MPSHCWPKLPEAPHEQPNNTRHTRRIGQLYSSQGRATMAKSAKTQLIGRIERNCAIIPPSPETESTAPSIVETESRKRSKNPLSTGIASKLTGQRRSDSLTIVNFNAHITATKPTATARPPRIPQNNPIHLFCPTKKAKRPPAKGHRSKTPISAVEKKGAPHPRRNMCPFNATGWPCNSALAHKHFFSDSDYRCLAEL